MGICLPSSGFSPSALGAGASGSGPSTGKLAVKAVAARWPDGSPVESGGSNYPNDIYIVDVDGRHVRNVTHDQRTETWMSWLPDGRRMVYENLPNDRMKPGASRIFVIKADGSDRHLLASAQGAPPYPRAGLSPELSPEGRRILFVAHGLRHRGLYVMQTDGRRKKRLTHSPEEEASWSPNARQIAFVRGFGTTQNPRSDIFVINADGTGLHRLTHTKDASDPAWSPDGSKIAFVRTFATPTTVQDFIYVMRADGTGVKRLAPRDVGAGPAWFSNNLVVYGGGGGASWWSIDANGASKPRPLRLPGRTRLGDRLVDRHGNDLGALSPDGKWIAFDTAGHRISVAHADGTHRRFITRKVCCLYLEIEWAPK